MILCLPWPLRHASTIWRLSFSVGSVDNEQPRGELQLSGCSFLGRDSDYVGREGRVQIQMLDIMESVDELSSIEDFRGVRK